MNIWQILQACRKQNMMVRFASFPGGKLNVGIYAKGMEKQALYDCDTLEELEARLVKDFGHLTPTFAPSTAPLIHKPSMPLPLGAR